MQGIKKNQKCGVGGESRQWILRKRTISSKKCVRITPKSLDDEVGEDAAKATPLADSPSLKRKAEGRNSPYRLRPRAASKDCNSEKKQRIISRKPKTPPPEIVQPQKLKTGTRGPVERPAADGYNWRKYGRKHIRVFGKVRNYYKCTYPSCPMRKNVDESLKERMKHTIYIGEHNHDKPQRLRMCWTYLINKFSSRLESSEIILDALVTDANASKSIKATAFEKDPSTHLQFQSTCHINPLVEEEGMQLSARGCEAVQVTSRRKESVDAATLPPLVLEDGEFIMRSTRGSKNHKDGYSWHKYGEKLIKGNPHPRSYYKCSFIGCPMRKQVNKATKGSTDSVITYHGEHLHELPAFRS